MISDFRFQILELSGKYSFDIPKFGGNFILLLLSTHQNRHELAIITVIKFYTTEQDNSTLRKLLSYELKKV